MAVKPIPRGIRNHNPGNIEKTGAWRDWQGIAAQQRDDRFITFKSAPWGIRALARILITYRDKHKLDTVAKIISRWAPPSENNTKAYIAAVAAAVGVMPNQPIDVADYDIAVKLIPAIIKHENGVMPYRQDVIDEGLKLAGVVPDHMLATAKKSTAAVGTVAVGTVTAGAGTAYVAVQIHETVGVMNQVGRAKIEAGDAQAGLMYVGGGLAIVVAGAVALAYLAWRKSRVRKEE